MNKKLAGELREQLNKKNRLDSDVQGGEMRSPFPTVTEKLGLTYIVNIVNVKGNSLKTAKMKLFPHVFTAFVSLQSYGW